MAEPTAMETSHAEKRKEPEPEEPKESITCGESKAPTAEPPAKKAKPTPAADAAALKKQVEYYLSDDNLKYDKFFHEKIAGDSAGWLEMSLVLSCNKMKSMRATREDVIAALKDSKVEIREDGQAIRRPGNAKLPSLESRPQHQKKSSANAHAGGPVLLCKGVPPEQSWMQVKEAFKAKVPAKVCIWHVSEVNDKNQCYIVTSPFENCMQFFDSLTIEVGGAKLKPEVAHGEVLQAALKQLPKNIKDKREKEARKKQKERNRPIVVGSQKFMNVASLRGRIREILNSRSQDETLKADGSDFKLIRAVLAYHPMGAEKSAGLVGIKVGKSTKGNGEGRCFFMIKEGGIVEDFSAKKCVDAIEQNPPYVEAEPKDSKEKQSKEEEPKADTAAQTKDKAEAKPDAPAQAKEVVEDKAEAKPVAPAQAREEAKADPPAQAEVKEEDKAEAKPVAPAQAREEEAKADPPAQAEVKEEVATCTETAEAPKANECGA